MTRIVLCSVMKSSCHVFFLIFVVFGPSATSSQKPRAFWYFNDKHGTPFKDVSANGHPALPFNVIMDHSISTSNQEAVHFTGQNGSSVTVKNTDAGLDVNSFTLMMHIDPNGVVENESVLFTFQGENDLSTRIYLTTKRELMVEVYDERQRLVNFIGVKGIHFGSWNLVAVAFNHRTGRVDVRLGDKYRKSSSSTFKDVKLPSGSKLWFGSDESGSRAYEGHLTCAALFSVYVDIKTFDWSVYTKQCFDPKIECSDLKCGDNQECREVEGIAQCLCQPGFINHKGVCKGHGLCTVTGDPHGYSFDGQENKFQGACTYVWARDGCSHGYPDDDQKPRFLVATKNWRREEGVKVSWVKEIIVVVDGRTIELKQEGDVFLDGQKAPGLPIQVNDDVRVYDKPNYVYVDTTFGLEVMWDRTFSARISLTADYREKVCGMCGDFDENPDNDWIIGPNTQLCSLQFANNRTVGSKTKHEVTFGVSWMYGSDTSSECLNSCRPPPPGPACTDEERQAAHDNCTALLDTNGPLEDCIKALGEVRINDIFKDCVYDECSADFNGTAILCGDASLMTDECSAEFGISIVWRGLEFCPLDCPENAFYTTCMTECFPSCDDEKGEQCTPTGICQEGCQCESGFVFGDGECIRPHHCGCEDDEFGGIVPIGDDLVHGDCEEICTCEGHADMQCEPMKCRDDQTCKIVEGIKQCACMDFYGDIDGKCVAPASCRCSGDPHCYMFDGGHFSYQGSCLYTMVQDGCQDGLPDAPPNFQVVINNDRMSGKRLASRVKEVVVIFPKMNTTLILHQGGMVSINGADISLPFLKGDYISLFDAPDDLVLQSFSQGLLVKWNRLFKLTVTIAGRHFGRTCGLCGSFNGNEKDDMVMGPTEMCMPDDIDISPGTMINDEVIFGSSWFHSSDEDDKNCDTDCKKLPYPPNCSNKQAKELCGNLKKKKGPLGPCVKALGKSLSKIAYQDCLFDTCTMNEVTDKYACASAEQMASTCDDQYGLKFKWRSKKFCPQRCTDHATYLECGATCAPNCGDPDGKRCTVYDYKRCIPGCFCDDGFIFYDELCRPKAECAVLRKPCTNLAHPEIPGELYSARVQCLSCKNEADDQSCQDNGSWETCQVHDAICTKTTMTRRNGRVSISRGCLAKAECPISSVGEDLCKTKKGVETCFQCNYGSVASIQAGHSVFRCQMWENRDACGLKRDSGKGKDKLGRFFFNPSKCKCMPMTYKGNHGNDNNFSSAAECGAAWGSWVLPEHCLLPLDNGTGQKKIKMFTYNAKKNKCERFKFNGEGGNDNRFRGKKECQDACMQC